jgi:hypothetical protein
MKNGQLYPIATRNPTLNPCLGALSFVDCNLYVKALHMKRGLGIAIFPQLYRRSTEHLSHNLGISTQSMPMVKSNKGVES